MNSYIFKSDNDDWYIDIQEEFTEKSKTRAYVTSKKGDDSTEALSAFATELGLEHPFTSRGDYPALDKMWDRHNKLIVAKKRKVLHDGLIAAGFGSPQLKWSRKAGCSCGCSPGFILATPRNTSIWIGPYDNVPDSYHKLCDEYDRQSRDLRQMIKSIAELTAREEISPSLAANLAKDSVALERLKVRIDECKKRIADMIDRRPK